VYVCVCVCVYMHVCCVCGLRRDVCVRLSMHIPSNWGREGDWSSGMIPALGAGGREFDSRITPFCLHSFAST
jgi:hypothetical protein